MNTLQQNLQQHKLLLLDGVEKIEDGLDRIRCYDNLTLDVIYRPLMGRWQRRLRKYWEHFPFLDQSRWYSDWTKAVRDCDTIVIINGIRGRDVIEYIRQVNPTAQIFIYYNDTTDPEDRKAPYHYQGLGCQFYSFDKKDCETWGISYRHYCYTYFQGNRQQLLQEQEAHAISQDFFFIGVDRGRLAVLVELQHKLENLGCSTNFVIVGNNHQHYFGDAARHITQRRLSYAEIVQNIYESRCIVDIPQPRQTGITLRPMEAIFYEKKLLTSNADIMSYDFYAPENIFVLGERSLEELPGFLAAPYKKIPEEIIQRYTPEDWLNTFLEEK